MSTENTALIRQADYFHHIDPGFLNRRLCLSSLSRHQLARFDRGRLQEDDHLSRLRNDHLLVTIVLDMADQMGAPTLLCALMRRRPRQLFVGLHRLGPCPGVRTQQRVEQPVILDVVLEKPVVVAYHPSHIVSDTGRMTLEQGASGEHEEAIVGLLHDRGDRFEIEPLIMGAPTLEHPRNRGEGLAWHGWEHGEILAEDIDQFSKLTKVTVASADEWMAVMRGVSEEDVKRAFASLLAEPTKKDWGGEANDHFSASLSIGGRRRTAAFVLKGPASFREMTLEMCGKRADQIYRLAASGAEVSIVQHSHLIGEAVRATLRALTVQPGRTRYFCVIDGQATYRILKAYGRLPPTLLPS